MRIILCLLFVGKTSIMTKSISTFMAKCGSCGAEFEHPSLGDFSYGEIIFYTEDGKNQVNANAFDSVLKMTRLSKSCNSSTCDASGQNSI